VSRDRNGWFYLAIGWIATLIVSLLVVATVQVGEDFIVPAMIVLGIVAAITLRGPVGQALAMRIRGDPLSSELGESLHAELDDLRARVLELEERLDFSERLLAQSSDPERLRARERLPGS
jgi:hypothetical protein